MCRIKKRRKYCALCLSVKYAVLRVSIQNTHTLKSGSGTRFLKEPIISNVPEAAATIRPYVDVLQNL